MRLRLFILLFLLVLCAGAGIVRAWQVRSHRRWIEHASIEELAAAAPTHLNEAEIFEQLGSRALATEQWARAAKAYQHAAELEPDRLTDWVGWARAIYEFGGFRPADAILSSYIARHPREARAYMERAALRRNANRSEMAWHDADTATKIDPRSGNAWALRGDLSLDQGIPGEGEASFLKARDLMPNSPWPYVGLYQAEVNEKRLDDALADARIIVRRFPQVLEGKLYLGEALFLTATSPQDYDAARSALTDVLKRAGELRRRDHSAAEMLLGRAYLNQHRWKEALVHLQRADAIAPGNPDTLFLLARVNRALGNSAAATAAIKRHDQVYADTAKVRQYNARINAHPMDANLRLEFARWYLRKGIPQNAMVQYEEMVDRGLDVKTARREIHALEQAGVSP